MYTVDYTQIGFFHPKLMEIMEDIENIFGHQSITSLWRKNGVHESIPLRAVDLRCRNDAVGREIERYINAKWAYDPERPAFDVCLYHDSGTGMHLHVQCHNNTLPR